MKMAGNCDAINGAGLSNGPTPGWDNSGLCVYHEHLLSIYPAFFNLACLWITLRKCL
jgi:hypothetical protein